MADPNANIISESSRLEGCQIQRTSDIGADCGKSGHGKHFGQIRGDAKFCIPWISKQNLGILEIPAKSCGLVNLHHVFAQPR